MYKALNHRLSNVGGFRHSLRCWNIGFMDNVGKCVPHKWAFRTWEWPCQGCGYLRLRGVNCKALSPTQGKQQDLTESGSGKRQGFPVIWVQMLANYFKKKIVCSKSTKHSFLILDNFMFMSPETDPPQRPFPPYTHTHTHMYIYFMFQLLVSLFLNLPSFL